MWDGDHGVEFDFIRLCWSLIFDAIQSIVIRQKYDRPKKWLLHNFKLYILCCMFLTLFKHENITSG